MKIYILFGLILVSILAACGSNPSPDVPAGSTRPPSANGEATGTAIALPIGETEIAEAPPAGTEDSVRATVTPPPLPGQENATEPAPPTLAAPTIPLALSPSVTPVPILPTRVPTVGPSPVPTQAPLQVTREGLRGKILFKSTGKDGKYPNRYDFFVMDADGSNVQQLNSEAGLALFQELKPLEGYSPDGQTLVLGETTCGGARCDLYIGTLHEIQNRSQGVWTPKGRFAASDPVWSPNGDWIAFVWTRDNQATKNLFKGPPQSNPTFVRLTNFGGRRDTKSPSYSADGSQLVFATQDGPRWQIWILDATPERDCSEDDCPSSPHNLSNSQTDSWDPIWIK